MQRNRQVRPYGKSFLFLQNLIIIKTNLEDGCIMKDPKGGVLSFFFSLFPSLLASSWFRVKEEEMRMNQNEGFF